MALACLPTRAGCFPCDARGFGSCNIGIRPQARMLRCGIERQATHPPHPNTGDMP